MSETTVYFDLDGVLANFDKAAEAALGTKNIYKFEFIHGQLEFWEHINRDPDFFLNVELMPDAHKLLEATQGLRTAILTALPKTNGEVVSTQKRAWVRRNIGDLLVITCFTLEKPAFCKPGDVLIDDRAVNKKAWEAAGGRYVVHTDAESTLAQLRDFGIISDGKIE